MRWAEKVQLEEYCRWTAGWRWQSLDFGPRTSLGHHISALIEHRHSRQLVTSFQHFPHFVDAFSSFTAFVDISQRFVFRWFPQSTGFRFEELSIFSPFPAWSASTIWHLDWLVFLWRILLHPTEGAWVALVALYSNCRPLSVLFYFVPQEKILTVKLARLELAQKNSCILQVPSTKSWLGWVGGDYGPWIKDPL